MSGTEDDSLNVWFLKLLDLSKSHHSCVKAISTPLAHHWSEHCLALALPKNEHVSGASDQEPVSPMDMDTVTV